MDSTRHQGSERGTHRAYACQEELAERIAQAIPEDGGVEPLRGLHLLWWRRGLLSESLDAASAGYRVGYDDASQFSREYKRLFGQPPLRDVERLREAARR